MNSRANTAINLEHQGLFIRLMEKDETRLVYIFLAFSVLCHLSVVMFDNWKWARLKPPLIEEWVISTDLVSPLDLAAADKETIPEAKKAEEAAAAENMLPQITKKYSIEEATEKKSDMTFDEEDKPNVAEEKKEEAKPDVEKNEIEQVQKDDDESNRLKKDEALKRLALEQLRNQQKKAKETEAPAKDALARLKSELSKSKTGIGEPGLKGTRRNVYQALLQKALQKNFALPEAYNLKNADLVVTISLILNERGDPTKVDIYKSSGDSVFDRMAMKTVYDSAPLPAPPLDEVGQEIHVNFTPRSL